ncbi:MAG: hypothetical protein ABEK75_03560 [Salinibacter sp.]
MHDGRPTHDEAACRTFLAGLLPDTRAALREELAPEGWADSPLADYVFSAPDEQESQARDAMEAVNEMLEDAGEDPVDDDVQELMFEHMHQRDPSPDVGDTGACDVIGMALWDVFSDNHDVVDPDGVAYHLGSFRGSAGTIAEVLNETYGLGRRYTYIDFYMGASLAEDDEPFRSVYEWIFRRLYERDCDWHYTFPRLYLVSFDTEEDTPDDPAAYDPAASVERNLEREEKEEEIEELREELDRMHREAVETATEEPPPLVVQAYETVFGEWPSGWPPSAD